MIRIDCAITSKANHGEPHRLGLDITFAHPDPHLVGTYVEWFGSPMFVHHRRTPYGQPPVYEATSYATPTTKETA